MMMGTRTKPRLTNKVMDGLKSMLSHISAGEALEEDGELFEDREQIHAAAKWIADMAAHRRATREEKL